jgi:hypothetical protein
MALVRDKLGRERLVHYYCPLCMRGWAEEFGGCPHIRQMVVVQVRLTPNQLCQNCGRPKSRNSSRLCKSCAHVKRGGMEVMLAREIRG